MLDSLNPTQRHAVLHEKGPAVVFAVAGSGKTRIITHRLSYLIDRGVPPWQILCLTFTNKAAKEMKERSIRLNPKAEACLVSTFHSACARWLREFATEIGYDRNFSIYDDSEAKSALKTVLPEVINEERWLKTPALYSSAIEAAKMYAYGPEDCLKLKSHGHELPYAFEHVYKAYQSYLRSCQSMDFSDLIMNMVHLLESHSAIQSIFQKRYSFIMVDEFQDTNPSQYKLLQLMLNKEQNLFVVGDDDQSIYSWRGASPANLVEFDKVFPDASRFVLARNYRSAQNIVDAAKALIEKNNFRVLKKVYSEIPPFQKITLSFLEDDQREAWNIAERICSELKDYTYQDFAIFYRTNAQSRAIEEALSFNQIPYKIFGSVRFYDRMEVKDLLAYLKILVNPQDTLSIKRIINTPARGIGQTSISKIEAYAFSQQISMLVAVKIFATKSDSLAKKLKGFLDCLEILKKQIDDAHSGREWIQNLLALIDYESHIRKKFPDLVDDKLDNIQEVKESVDDFYHKKRRETADIPNIEILQEWLQQISLYESDSKDLEESGYVSMMSLHLAKGLEFKVVFVTGLEEQLLPHRNCPTEPEIEEERRLLYVGMTRAMEKLYLTSVNFRGQRGGSSYRILSRFIHDIPEDLLKVENKHLAQKNLGPLDFYGDFNTTSRFSKPPPSRSFDQRDYEDIDVSLKKGAQVSHATYGMGRVRKLIKQIDEVVALVDFDEFGEMKVKVHHLDRLY